MITEYFHNLNTAHKRVSPEIMASMVSSGQPQGIPIPDMTDELQQLGYSMIQKNNATMDDLTNALQSGPVLVNVFTGKFHHAVVVSGIKTDGSLVLNDPLEKADVIFSGSEFLREWDAGGNYLYVIRPE
jgi:predicted double-glycine peptidase